MWRIPRYLNAHLFCFISLFVAFLSKKFSRRLVLYVGIPGLLLWCAGVPALFLGALWRERKRLGQEEVRVYLGFLYLGYKQQYYYWEVIVILRKFAVVAITTLVQSKGTSRVQMLMLMLGTIWLALVMQVCLHSSCVVVHGVHRMYSGLKSHAFRSQPGHTPTFC